MPPTSTEGEKGKGKKGLEEPGEEEKGKHKVIAKADRRLSQYERESRFLVKRSEDYEVFDDVFDVPTLMVITGMINDGIIRYVKSSLAAGKESKVYLAVAPDDSFLTLKIYLTVSAEFKRRMQYIAGDPRFSGLKKGLRSLIAAWAKKEFKNMQTAYTSGVRVPAPIAVQRNVLVMEFIGDGEGNPAPQLVDAAEVSVDDYKEVIEQVTLLYRKAKLVHADLSEYNIFKTDGGVVLFDFGSAVDLQHPNSKQFLVRDLVNINRFFAKRGVETTDIDHVLKDITREES